MDLRRRTFLKATGLVAAGALLPGCERETHRLVPYVLPDDEIVPGVADWYASVCNECSAGCGVLVRVREGRAKKLEGNPDHPANRGKLCVRGQASLQSLYNPDRLRRPFQRDGRRGEGTFVPIEWEEGLCRCAQAFQGMSAPPLMVTKPLSGTLARLLSDFMDSVGGKLYFYAPDAELPLHAAWHESLGSDVVYDLAQTDYLLSFGAPFLEHWLSPVAMGVAFGHMRQGRPTVRGRYIHIEPRMSVTAANADQWLPIRPGTEGVLALGIGKIILDDHGSGFSGKELNRYRTFYGTARLDEVEKVTGFPRDVIVRLAHDFASARAPLAIGGGTSCAQTNGTVSLTAINGLNALVESVGRESVVRRFRHDGDRPDRSIPWLTEQKVFELAGKQGKTGGSSVLLLYGCNPLFTMPPSVPIKAMFEQASCIVSFSAFLDESTEWADLLLPDRDALESWDDHVAEATTEAVGLSQPVVTPLYDIRQIGDTILDVSRRLKLGHAQAQTFYDLLRERWKTFLADKPHEETPDWFDKAWVAHLQQGGWWRETNSRALPLNFTPSRVFEQAIFSGEEREFPFVFHPYPSMAIGHGEGANRPWLQELPDTLTTVVWGSWVEVNPTTARDLGISQGDMVRVVSPVGSLEAPAILFPGIRPDVVAMPLGQGHSGYGRYAKNRGVNPIGLLAPALDTVTGTLASGATRVRIERTGVKGRLVTLEQSPMEHSDLITIKRKD